MDPIPARQVKVEQPQPCDLFVIAEFGPDGWTVTDSYDDNKQAQKAVNEYAKQGHVRLFHLSDAPSAPLAVDAGVMDALAEVLDKSFSHPLPWKWEDVADDALTYLRSQGWGPKGEEFNDGVQSCIDAIIADCNRRKVMGLTTDQTMSLLRSLKHGGA